MCAYRFSSTQSLLPLLRLRPGQIVFVNSKDGGQATTGLYASTKHALKAFADSLRQEVKWKVFGC